MEDEPISKNKLKKLKRDQEWEEKRDERKAYRKMKLREKKQRQRSARGGTAADPGLAPVNQGSKENARSDAQKTPWTRYSDSVQLPITIVLDCGFDDLMTDKERKSLAAQVTRCYSDNHKAPFRAHLAISSFGGSLKERFDGILSGHYSSWKGVHFLDGDFTEAISQARAWMEGPQGGKVAGALVSSSDCQSSSNHEKNSSLGETVYLTSDSSHTLSSLKPYSTYIVGGLVDRNRHKGMCYKRAMDREIRTAKLPIGEYMQMNSRFVLATNHVSEIMLRWLELGDWAKAFMRVVPKRKGGILKNQMENENSEEDLQQRNRTDKQTLETKGDFENVVPEISAKEDQTKEEKTLTRGDPH